MLIFILSRLTDTLEAYYHPAAHEAATCLAVGRRSHGLPDPDRT